MNWHSFFFLLFSLVAIVFALAVVFTSHIVRMAFYLTLSLGATSGLFFLAGADFVGAMQLLIYVGGTLVLLIFGVMLTAQGPFISMKTDSSQWLIAAVVGGSLLAVLLSAAFRVREWRELPDTAAVAQQANEPTATPLGMALLGTRVDADEFPAEKQAGLAGYLLPFEIISVHLLVVLIGAAYLARAKKRARSRAMT
jgi:NADH-quinone oxidoreductase subunit J